MELHFTLLGRRTVLMILYTSILCSFVAKEYGTKCKRRQAKGIKNSGNKLFNLGGNNSQNQAHTTGREQAKSEKTKLPNRVIHNSQTKNRNADNLTKTTWGKGCILETRGEGNETHVKIIISKYSSKGKTNDTHSQETTSTKIKQLTTENTITK